MAPRISLVFVKHTVDTVSDGSRPNEPVGLRYAPPGSVFITVPQALRALGISRRTLSNLTASGKLTSYKRTGRRGLFFDQSEVRELTRPWKEA